jgi:U2-associated protein SR140
MFTDGEWWIPPEQTDEDDEEVRSNPDEEEARLANRARGFLGLSGQRKFLWLLRGVDGRRGSIARAMAYAMDRADAAEEVPATFASYLRQIVDVLIASLCSNDTPLPKKIARLYLASDILHNSSSGRTNVWKYRQLYVFRFTCAHGRFEARLAPVFNHLHEIYASFDGRIKADNFRRQIMAVTSVWETWMIFNNNNVESWANTFLGRADAKEQTDEEQVDEMEEKPVERKGKWKSVIETSGKEAAPTTEFTNTSPNSHDNENDENDDGEQMEEDVDGMPMDEDNVDGEPMDDDDYVDGEPMDDEDAKDDDMDSESMDDEDAEDAGGEKMKESTPPPVPQPESTRQSPVPPVETQTRTEANRPQRRPRMRAVDLFTDD